MRDSPGTRRLARYALPAIALALLVAGLAGPIQREWQAREAGRAAAALAEKLAAERAALQADYAANRGQILARLREQIDTGHFAAAMNGAGRYVPLGDAELLALYRTAAETESVRQRAAFFRDLVARDCTETQARLQFSNLQRDEHSVANDPNAAVEVQSATRVGAVPARAVVNARLREPPPSEHGTVVDADWLARARAENRARPLPEYLAGLAKPDSDALICVWRIEGKRRNGDRDVRFSLDLWLAPAPDGRALQPDPVAYSERPA